MYHKYIGQGYIAHYCTALAGQAEAAGHGSSSSDYITSSTEGERLLKGAIMSQCHLLVVLCGTAGTALTEWR